MMTAGGVVADAGPAVSTLVVNEARETDRVKDGASTGHAPPGWTTDADAQLSAAF